MNVSITITTYNRAALLEMAIESVLRQTYPYIELIIVNDCSRDSTKKILEQYANDTRITIVNLEQNQGNAIARNIAIQNSSYELIAFMDDDDIWCDPGKLEKQVKEYITHDCDNLIVCSSVRLLREHGFVDKEITESHHKKKILSGNGFIYSPSVLTSKKLIERVGYFDPKVRRGVDSDFYRNAILNFNAKVVIMPEILVEVREYGSDRMSIGNTRSAAKKIIISNYMAIVKYWRHYFRYPGCLFVRFWNIVKNIFKLLILVK